jgi:transcriptional regulator with XRE-family HTH domain
MLTASELAATLGVSKGRVSQYVSERKLDGCFDGEGRGRRFDLAKCAAALGRTLDPGQMMGNGASTRKALRGLAFDGGEAIAPPVPESSGRSKTDGELPSGDAARYEMARTQKAEEEVRRLRRDNELNEGTLVKASEVERQLARIVAQELAEFETVLRDGARKVADRMGVDFKAVRQALVETWRAHREGRVAALSAEAEAAAMTDAEIAADI